MVTELAPGTRKRRGLPARSVWASAGCLPEPPTTVTSRAYDRACVKYRLRYVPTIAAVAMSRPSIVTITQP
jgi:hypothetical protein